MNYAFYILPVLLAVSIPSAFAEVGKNYDTVINEDGSVTWTSHPERILVGDEWQNYFLTVNESKVIFNSNSIGSFVYDIDTCSYSLYENGYNGNQIIPSVSIVGTHNNNGTWENLAVNDESCLVEVIENEKGIVLTSTKTIMELENIPIFTNSTGVYTDNFIEKQKQKLQQTLQIDIRKGIKESFELWDDSGNELGISQTLHTGPSIEIGNQLIDIETLSGQSFDRDFIINNEAEILQIASSMNYDFDTGLDSLTAINIIHDSDYKVNLDYASGGFKNYLFIDPTFTQTGSISGSNWDFDLSTLPNNSLISSGDIEGTALTSSQITSAENAQGGTWSTPTTAPTYKYHKFTSSSTFTTNANLSIDFLLIGGGGGGGGEGGAGGGSGGGLYQEGRSLSSGSYSITIGSGGVGSYHRNSPTSSNEGGGFNL